MLNSVSKEKKDFGTNCYQCEIAIPAGKAIKVKKGGDGDTIFLCKICRYGGRKKKLLPKDRVCQPD